MANQATSKSGEQHAERHAHGPGRYWVVWLILIVATYITARTGRMDLGGANLPLALAIATVKASLVVLFFMHMTEAAGANRIVFIVSLLFLLLMLAGVFGDLLTRSEMSLPSVTPTLEQTEAPAVEEPH